MPAYAGNNRNTVQIRSGQATVRPKGQVRLISSVDIFLLATEIYVITIVHSVSMYPFCAHFAGRVIFFDGDDVL